MDPGWLPVTVPTQATTPPRLWPSLALALDPGAPAKSRIEILGVQPVSQREVEYLATGWGHYLPQLHTSHRQHPVLMCFHHPAQEGAHNPQSLHHNHSCRRRRRNVLRRLNRINLVLALTFLG